MSNLYAQRRQQLLTKLNQGTAIFRSAPMAVMHNDVEYTFRQDSDFFYLTGFNEPEAVAVLAPHHDEHQFILFVRPKDLDREIWTGYRTGVEAAQERYGADIAYSIEELDEKLPQYLKGGDRIYYHLGRDESFNDRILRHWRKQLALYPKRGTGPIALEDPSPLLHPLRLVKTPEELQLMRQAADIAVEAHNLARDIAQPGRYEYEVQAEMERLFTLHGGSPAYPSIVASGGNACILHYVENNCQMEEGDLLLIDAGCSYQYYNSDITRTFPVSGKFSPEQKMNNGFEAVKWCINYNWIQQGYTLLQETLISFILKNLGKDWEDEILRTTLNACAGIIVRKEPEEEWKGVALKYKDIARELSQNEIVIKFSKINYQLTDFRNDMNHAGIRKDPKPFSTLKQNLPIVYKEIVKMVHEVENI